jgi:hypothetical protein
MNPNIYVYKMVTDNGGAPCVWGGLLSLAICKPKIRGSAEKNDLVFGFGGKRYDEKLIYIAKITNKPETGEYYQKREYSRRPDCIYKNIRGRPVRKSRARYHNQSDERRRDVGIRFQRAYVVLSDNFRYFGRKGDDRYKRDYPMIRRLIEGLKRGHRVNHSPAVRKELLKLQKTIWARYRRMKLGSPTDSDPTKLCNSDTPSARVCGR